MFGSVIRKTETTSAELRFEMRAIKEVLERMDMKLNNEIGGLNERMEQESNNRENSIRIKELKIEQLSSATDLMNSQWLQDKNDLEQECL